MKAIRLLPLLIALFVINPFSQSLYHGVPAASYPDYPNWQEQATIVFTNAVRMAPAAFRDKYMSPSYTILLPQNYPAVNPAFWNLNLNRSSRTYALDMANNCGWIANHNSCDGTAWDARIKSFYTVSGTIAENKATGYAAPQQTVIQWLKDTVTTTRTLAADKSADDGHRRNIMNSAYLEMGAGYAYSSTKQWYYFWVQDFGGAQNQFAGRPIVSGSHLFLTANKITFMANYYDTTGQAPQSASVVVENVTYPMPLHLGVAARGTYDTAITLGTLCRTYYFSFKDDKGKTWLYPEKGRFATYGEGTCAKYYVPPESISTETSVHNLPPAAQRISASLSGRTLTLRIPAALPPVRKMLLFSVAGKVVQIISPEQNERASSSIEYKIPVKSGIPPGIYFLAAYFQDASQQAVKVVCFH